MSSRRQVPVASGLSSASVRPSAAAAPTVANNRTASLTSRLKMVTSTIRSNANRRQLSNNEISSAGGVSSTTTSDAATLKPTCRLTSSSTKESSVSSAAAKAKAAVNSTSSLGNAKPTLWPSRSASHRVAPSKSATFKSLKDDMVSSTGTESSGVYSDSDSLGTAIKSSLGNSNPSLLPATSRLRPPSAASSASRITTAIVKTTSKLVRRPVTTPNDQSVLVELRNENLQLKNQIDRLKYELEEKYKNDLAAALAEKEKQHQQEMEAKEAAWRVEMETRLADERTAAERQLADEKLRHDGELRAAEASRADERQTWQRTLDNLAQRASEALADKERIEKNVRLEVENQVQGVIQRYNELKQETSSLQTVVEMRTQELRNVTQHLEMAKLAANEVPTLRERNLTLTNTIEDLQAQLERKAAEERRLLSELAKSESGYKEACIKIRALTSHKDQLEWRLQQRHQSPTHAYYANDGDRASPVRVHPAPGMTSTPSETPKSSRKTFTYPPSGLSPIISEHGALADGENNNNNNIRCSGSRKSSLVATSATQQRRSSADANHASGNDASGSDLDDVFNGGTSPTAVDAAATQLLAAGTDPSSATTTTTTVRDVTKKNDSISYVLELGDEHHPPAVLPTSPWQRRRPLGRSYSLRAPKHSKSH